MATTKKPATDKKTVALEKPKTKEKLTARQLLLLEKDPKKISKTGLAFREAMKNPWIIVNDWKAVDK